MGALGIPKLTADEYLALDRTAEVPAEFHDGEMFPIEAVTVEHARISFKIQRCVDRQLQGTGCEVLGAPLRVRVSPTKFVLPDLLIACGGLNLTDDHQDTITNPKVIIEILSPATADYDYGYKFRLYRRLASFEEYVLVSQDEARAERFRKAADDNWALSTHQGLAAIVPIESLRLALPLAEIYAGIKLREFVED